MNKNTLAFPRQTLRHHIKIQLLLGRKSQSKSMKTERFLCGIPKLKWFVIWSINFLKVVFTPIK